MATVSGATSSPKGCIAPSTDISGMIVKLSEEKLTSLDHRIKAVLSDHLGNALSDQPNHSSNAYFRQYDGALCCIATSVKKEFLNTPFFDDLHQDLNNGGAKLAQGREFVYTLADLKSVHAWKRNIITNTPDLDPLIQVQLAVAVAADSEYVLGLKLDMDETRSQEQPVFAIFEKDKGKEISRVLVSASKL